MDITGVAEGLSPRASVQLKILRENGKSETISLLARLDTKREVEYYRHGGQLHFVVRDRLEKAI
jgi:aconitate hydratase